ncbi:hypothetical protein VP1G_11451 [Cytospora mali]|uniref:Uncharacterized protein n=1 Tax=Cytospora mali TaxID=578113 RepID=A0A194VH42_CYTMA|nr:hypothetical protein VP1G_11451 [Valsa mali var. pyri (nom. inval.)]
MSDRTIWDDKAHLDLLMAVLNNATLTSKEWDKILADLRVKGYNYTSSAAIPLNSIKLLGDLQSTTRAQLLLST